MALKKLECDIMSSIRGEKKEATNELSKGLFGSW